MDFVYIILTIVVMIIVLNYLPPIITILVAKIVRFFREFFNK